MSARPAIALAAALALLAGCAGAPPAAFPGGAGGAPGWRERVMVEVPRAGGEPCFVEKPAGYDPRNWVNDFADWIEQCLRLGRVRPRPRLDV